MFKLNTEQQAMFTIIESARIRLQDRARQHAFTQLSLKLNTDLDTKYAKDEIGSEEYIISKVIPTPGQVTDVVNNTKTPFSVLRDYGTVGFQLPQRTGASSFAQWLLADHMAKNPQARCAYLGPNDIDLFDVENSKCDVHSIKEFSDYDRVCKTIAKQDNVPPYSLVVFDCADYFRVLDARFMQLLGAMHKPVSCPTQMLVHFSS